MNNAGISNLCMFEEATEITNFTPVMVKKESLASHFVNAHILFQSTVL